MGEHANCTTGHSDANAHKITRALDANLDRMSAFPLCIAQMGACARICPELAQQNAFAGDKKLEKIK
jgi:hypothetical protein